MPRGPHDDGRAVTGHYHEVAAPDRHRPQVWGDTDRQSYGPGEVLALHAISSAVTARLEVLRDGLTPQTLIDTEIAFTFEPTPEDCSVTGCNWPERCRLTLPAD